MVHVFNAKKQKCFFLFFFYFVKLYMMHARQLFVIHIESEVSFIYRKSPKNSLKLPPDNACSSKLSIGIMLPLKHIVVFLGLF
jgi:hypothetical protein